jgi:hypothetical protein
MMSENPNTDWADGRELIGAGGGAIASADSAASIPFAG